MTLSTVSFLFDPMATSDDYLSDDNICRCLVGALISRSPDEPTDAYIRSGRLLLHQLAYRTVEVSEVNTFGNQRSMSWTQEAKASVWAYLLADFSKSIAESWHNGSVDRIEEALRNRSIEIYTVGPVTLDTADAIHHAIGSVEGYIGSMEVDRGHLVQYQVCWSGLIERYQICGTELGLLARTDIPPEEQWSLSEDRDRWWHTVGASDLYWTSPDDPRRHHPQTPERLEDSQRGRDARFGLTQLMHPTPLERLVNHVTPENLPNDTKRFSAQRLSQAADAIIPREKLQQYALNLKHPTGRDKAYLFEKLLDITASDWSFLSQQLLRGIRDATTYREIDNNGYGVQFSIITGVRGRNGVVKPVVSAWIVLPEQPPSLVTTYIADRRIRVETDAIGTVPVLPVEQREDWQLLFEIATAAADDVARLTVPVPMYVSIGEDGPGDWYMGGAEGSAYVIVHDARRGFARWLRLSEPGTRTHMRGSWIAAPFREYDICVAWANAFAEVLQWHDVSCEVKHFMT